MGKIRDSVVKALKWLEPKVRPALDYWGKGVWLLSGEWLLTDLRCANGGDVILARSLFIATELSLISHPFSPDSIPGIVRFSAVFAAAYAALYARFSQQFQYMSNLYNQIKQAEVRAAEKATDADVITETGTRLAEWKAGYIEDAETLHLSTKPMVASVIVEWAKRDAVKVAFKTYTAGGEKQFEKILRDAAAAFERDNKRWQQADDGNETNH